MYKMNYDNKKRLKNMASSKKISNENYRKKKTIAFIKADF